MRYNVWLSILRDICVRAMGLAVGTDTKRYPSDIAMGLAVGTDTKRYPSDRAMGLAVGTDTKR